MLRVSELISFCHSERDAAKLRSEESDIKMKRSFAAMLRIATLRMTGNFSTHSELPLGCIQLYFATQQEAVKELFILHE